MCRFRTNDPHKDKGDGKVALRIKTVGTAIVFWLGASCAHASTLTPDLSPLHPSLQTLARDGDFDGDGSRDELYLSDEPESGRVAVHVRLNTASGMQDIRVTSLDASVDSPLDLHVVKAGTYAADCGNFASDCGPAIVAGHDSLILALDSGSSVLMHWQNDHFETDFVRNDEAELARAASAMYAVNP